MVGLEINKFKEWTGFNRDNQPGDEISKKHTTPQANMKKGSLSSGFAFNNDRNAIGTANVSQVSGIIRKQDRDPMNVKDISGATSKTKSYIMNKLYNQKANIEQFLKSSSSLQNHGIYAPSEIASERPVDTKRFMRVDDIEGTKPKFRKDFDPNNLLLTNSPLVEQAYQNSEYFKKQKERQGRLPFTRRVNKGDQFIDRSLVTTIDPYTGEDYRHPYINVGNGNPNERMRRNIDRERNEELNYTNNTLHDLRAKRVQSKRSHKLGLSKDYAQNQKRDQQNASYIDNDRNHLDSNIEKQNRTIDNGSRRVERSQTQNNQYEQTPQKMASKREHRLRDFYARSQRKDTINNRASGTNFQHFISQDRTPNKLESNALDIMNLSQQLDHRNIQRHNLRNFDLGSDGRSILHDTVTMMKNQHQRSYEDLPRVLMKSSEKLPLQAPSHPRGKSHMDPNKKQFERDVTRSNFIGAGDSNSFNLNNIKINPITGVVSPLQNKKTAVF